MLARRTTWVTLAMTFALCGCGALTTPHQHIVRAQRAMDQGQWGRAAIELRQVVRSDSKNRQAWLLLAKLSLNAADPAGAQSALAHAMTAGAKGSALDDLRAQTWLAAGEPKALIAAVENHQVSLSEGERQVMLARAYEELGQPDQAIAVLAPVLAAHPDADARLTDAQALDAQGKSDDALAQLHAITAADPKSSDAPLLRGQILSRRGQYADAEKAFETALQNMKPSTSWVSRGTALIGLTEARLAQGKVDLAAKSQAALARIGPSAISTQLLGARIKLARGDALGGISDLQRLVTRVPTLVQAQILLGAAELQQGNLQQARQALEQVILQDPTNVQAREMLASLQLKLNQPDQALSVLTPALGAHAADPQMLGLLSQVEQRTGSSDATLAALEKALQAQPKNRTLRLNLAQAYLSAGRAPQALNLLQGVPETTVPGSAVDQRRDGLLIAAVKDVRGPAAAGAQVDKLLAAHPHDEGLLNLAAGYFASVGSLTRARALLNQSLVQNPHAATTLLALARVQMMGGDLAAAETSLRAALAADPTSVAARVSLADVLASRKDFAQSEQVLQAGKPSQSGTIGAQLQFALARVALAHGDVKGANAALDQAITDQSGHAEAVEAAGTLLLQAHQYDAALARFVKANGLVPDNAVYWVDTARAQMALNQPAAARTSLDKADQLQPQWLPAVSGLVLLDLHDKNYQSALARVNALLGKHPNDAGALALKGEVEWAAGQRAAAETDYAAAQRRGPSQAVAVALYRVRLAERRAHPEQALVSWLAQQPNDEAVRLILGNYYLGTHALKDAAGQFEAILQQTPNNPIALNNLAWVYSQLHDVRAEGLAERAHALAPKAANISDTLGWILAGEGKVGQALPYLAQAAKADANDPDIQYHYAFVLVKQGQKAQAEHILSNLLATKRAFQSRADAERLLTQIRS